MPECHGNPEWGENGVKEVAAVQVQQMLEKHQMLGFQQDEEACSAECCKTEAAAVVCRKVVQLKPVKSLQLILPQE